MGYLLRTNTSYKHLAKKFERAVLTRVGRDGSEMAVSRRRFFARYRFLASENGIYELVSTFCHVPHDVQISDWSNRTQSCQRLATATTFL